MGDSTMDFGGHQIVIERIDSRIWYVLAWPVATLISALTFDDTGSMAPSKRYLVSVRATSGGRRLWEEETANLGAADLAAEWAEQIGRIGIDDWLFKKEHGWRID